MTKLFLSIVVLCISLFYPATTYAHGAGMPPYVKINNIFADSNPLSLLTESSVSTKYSVPLDAAPQNYLVNQELHFTLDNDGLLAFIPKELLDKTTFTWDFGDGTIINQKDAKHSYIKKGSYIITLTFYIPQKNSSTTNQYTDTILINILTTQQDKLPQAVIKVNDKLIKNAKSDTLNANFNNQILFDASNSLNANSEIVEYLWDFGDGRASTEKIVKHKYDNNHYVQTPVLRIKDEDGFLSYTFALMTNTQTRYRSKEEVKTSTKKHAPQIFIISGLVLILITSGTFWYLLKRKK